MAADKGFYEYIAYELFNNTDGITSRRMFDGYGFYKDGIFFALISYDNKLYFKVAENNKADYEAYESKPFTYPMKDGKMTSLSFWELPADIMENNIELPLWIDKAVEAAKLRKKKK